MGCVVRIPSATRGKGIRLPEGMVIMLVCGEHSALLERPINY
jgi:hypothetical protein